MHPLFLSISVTLCYSSSYLIFRLIPLYTLRFVPFMSDVIDGGAELFLYQSGYLTIKSYEDEVYTLGFPNEEVKRALSR